MKRTGIGGSDAGVIMGASTYKSALELYLEMIGESVVGDDNQTNAQYWGHKLEPVILNEYEEKTGIKLIRPTEMLTSPDHAFMTGHLDAISNDGKVVVDAKFIDSFSRWQWGLPGTSEMPDYILAQMIHYAILTNADRVDVAVLFTNKEFSIFTYHRNKDAEERIISIEHDFWHNHVLKRVPPSPKSNYDANKLWKQAVPDSSIEANDAVFNMFMELKDVRLKIKDLEKRGDLLEGEIKIFMEDKDTLMFNDRKIISWKNQESKRFNLGSFKADQPDVYDMYVDSNSHRVFRLSGG